MMLGAPRASEAAWPVLIACADRELLTITRLYRLRSAGDGQAQSAPATTAKDTRVRHVVALVFAFA